MDKGCIVEGCERKHHALGWCGTHYRRVLRGESLAWVFKQERDARVRRAIEWDWSDLRVAVYAGCSDRYVWQYRHDRGIPPSGRRG